ncbi:MAG: hypothetical protein PHX78_02030 [bacterium]|nr:hypothetical protein [bacterium]
METKAGLWIDHRKAIIVFVSDKGEEIKKIESNVEEQIRHSRGSDTNTSRYDQFQLPADDSRERDLTGHLNIYYDNIISNIRNAKSIFIFGPGESKNELKKRMEKENLGERITGIETIDKITDRQIEAKVKKYFKK